MLFYRKILQLTLQFLFLLVLISCEKEESISIHKGKVAFSLWGTSRSDGRASESATPAYVLLSIQDNNGEIQENMKLPLLSFGEGFLSEDLELQEGNYQLTQFLVLDEAEKIMYATPLEESELAKYVSDPLPIKFTVTNEITRVTPQVLAVEPTDNNITQKLIAEEYFIYDPANASSTDGFVGSHKREYTYDQNKLIRVDIFEYNHNSKSYSPGYKAEEYHYDSNGKLLRTIHFLGEFGPQWIHEYEYLTNESTKVTRYSSNNNPEDWWITERKHSLFTVKYYQLNNELYAELNYEMGENGNVISVSRSPTFNVGKIYYKYDNSPNPYKFPELGGEYGYDTEKYLSQNNVIEETNEFGMKSIRIIEYNNAGYPVLITAPTVKRKLTYG